MILCLLRTLLRAAPAILMLLPFAALGKDYGPGVTDHEIVLGQTMAYSGPASAYATYGRLETAYFRMVNDKGGVHGRRIRLVSLDDGMSPPKTVEQTRRLVEQEGVLLVFGSVGTAANAAVMKYLNQRKVPQLFVSSAAAKFYDPKRFPWTMGILFNYEQEAGVYAGHVLSANPGAKVALLYQNDDFGKDYVRGFRAALGSAAERMIVAEATYELTDPTIDSQIITLQASGADTLVDVTYPKFAAQVIRKLTEIGWKPMHFLPFPSSSQANVLAVGGLERSVGILSASSLKDPNDPQWREAPDVRQYLEFMRTYYPEGDITDQHNVLAYVSAYLIVHVLRQCADDLGRENVLRQATSLRDLDVPLLLPGIRVSNSPARYQQVAKYRLRRFDGRQWQFIGDIIDADAGR